jgi:hypothetical protein
MEQNTPPEEPENSFNVDSPQQWDENYSILPLGLFYKDVKISFKPFGIRFVDSKNKFNPAPLSTRIENNLSFKYLPRKADKYLIIFALVIFILIGLYLWSFLA